MTGLRIAVAADNAGVALKNVVADQLRDDDRVAEVVDLGVPDESDDRDYPLLGIAAAQAVADEIAALGGGAGKAIVVQADVGSVADNKRLVDEALRAFGRIDSVVLNAGHMDNRVLADVDEVDYDRHFNTNVKGPLFLVQAAAPHMKAGKQARTSYFILR